MAALTYLLYGDNPTYELEFLLSALSARIHLQRAGQAKHVRISLISDRPRFGPGFPFDVVVIDPEDLKRWMATPGRTYNHRLKVLALMDAMRRSDEAVALVDTDTFFIASPQLMFDRIGTESTVMHEREVDAIEQDPDCKDVVDVIRPGVVIDGFALSAATPMYNSGVVGVMPSHLPLVAQALSLLDTLYDRAPVFNVEQFAFGVVLSQRTRLHTCDDVVRHYWGHTRAFIHVQAARYLPLRTAAEFREREAQGSLPFLGEPTKAWQDQLAARVRGAVGAWSADYRFAYLAALSALRCAPVDSNIASAWASVALDDLRRLLNVVPAAQWRRDFAAFAAPAAALPWMQRDVHARWQQLLG